MTVKYKGEPVKLNGDKLHSGVKAKDFTTISKENTPVKLLDFPGKVKVITTFPSVDTSVCATQARTFNMHAAKLGNDVVIISISTDSPAALKNFCATEGISNVITTSDKEKLDFSNKYGFLISELGILTRGTIVIDKDDIIRYVEYVPEVLSEPNYNAALDSVRKLVASK